MKKLFEQLTTPEVMAEVLALLMAGLLATALAHYIKTGCGRWRHATICRAGQSAS